MLLSVLLYSQNLNFNTKVNNGYKITGEVKNLMDTSVILAYYFGGKQYASDTAFSKNGKFIFQGNEKLKG